MRKVSLSTESCRSAALVSMTRKPSNEKFKLFWGKRKPIIKDISMKLKKLKIVLMTHKPNGRKEEAAEANTTFLVKYQG